MMNESRRSGYLKTVTVWGSVLALTMADHLYAQALTVSAEIDQGNYVIAEPLTGFDTTRILISSSGVTAEALYHGAHGFSITGIGNPVSRIVYASPEAIWIFSRLGRRFDAAALMEVPGMSFSVRTRGWNYKISPDNQNVTYCEGTHGGALFLNNVMIYPFLEWCRTVAHRGSTEFSLRQVQWPIIPMADQWTDNTSYHAVLREVATTPVPASADVLNVIRPEAHESATLNQLLYTHLEVSLLQEGAIVVDPTQPVWVSGEFINPRPEHYLNVHATAITSMEAIALVTAIEASLEN